MLIYNKSTHTRDQILGVQLLENRQLSRQCLAARKTAVLTASSASLGGRVPLGDVTAPRKSQEEQQFECFTLI